MALSYDRLWKKLIDHSMGKTELTHLAGISTNAMAKMGRNESVQLNVLEKVCSVLECPLEEVIEIVPDDDPRSDRQRKEQR